MTKLNRKLRREVERTLDLDRHSRGRLIIIELEPPDLVHFRWKGTRRRYTASIGRLFQWTIQETVEQKRRERKAHKRARS